MLESKRTRGVAARRGAWWWWSTMLGLASAASSISCASLELGRGLAIALAAMTGGLVWLAARGHVRAGGSTASLDTGDTGSGTTATGGTGTGSTTDVGTTAAGSSTSSTTDPDTSGTTGTPGTTAFDTGPCLSAPESWSDTGDEGPLTACLSCACDQGRDEESPAGWAPALLLPALVRRRQRRASLEQLAARGALPDDVVARLRRRLAGDPDRGSEIIDPPSRS